MRFSDLARLLVEKNDLRIAKLKSFRLMSPEQKREELKSNAIVMLNSNKCSMFIPEFREALEKLARGEDTNFSAQLQELVVAPGST